MTFGKSITTTRRVALNLGAGLAASLAYPARAAGESGQTTSWIPREAEIEDLQGLMAKYAVPGISLAVVEDGDVAWSGAYGVSNIATGSPVTDATRFQAASLAKPVVTYVVMKFIEEGRLSLTSRLADYHRPDGFPNDSQWAAAITVGHVLSHQTGLPNWRDNSAGIAKLEPQFEPGTAYSYSGEAFHWLQQVCETITGRGLDVIMRQYLFGPAGLEDMAMLWLPEHDEREAFGHDISESGEPRLLPFQFAREHGRRLNEVAERWGRPMQTWTSHDQSVAHAVMRPHDLPGLRDKPSWVWRLPDFKMIDAPSSLRSTARDYARFVSLMMPGMRRTDWSIAEATRHAMLMPQTRTENPMLPVGYGWSLELKDGDTYFQHWGRNGPSYVSCALGDPQRRRGLVMMANGSKGMNLIEDAVLLLTRTKFQSIM